MRPPLVVALALASSVAVSPGAAASPLSDPTAGRAVFTGVVSPHPTSLQLNPAALGIGQPGNHLYLSGSGTLDQIGIDRQVVPAEGQVSAGPSISTTSGSAGGMLSYVRVNADSLVSSIGATVSTAPAETYLDGEPGLRYHSLGGSYREWSFMLGGSIRVDDFHIGASIGVVFGEFLNLSFARDTALAGGRAGVEGPCGTSTPCGIENPEAAEEYRIRDAGGLTVFSSERLVLSLGVLYRIMPDWWVGLAYRSPQGLGQALTLDGTIEVRRPPTANGPGSVKTGDVAVSIDLPQSLYLGLRGRITPAFDLIVNLGFEDLSRSSEFDVRPIGRELEGVPEWLPRPRGFQNVYTAVAGVEQVDAGQRFTFGGRVGVETGAVDAAHTSPMQISGLQLTADVGMQVRLLPPLVLQVGYGLGYFPEIDIGTDESAYDPIAAIRCADSGFDYSTPDCEKVRTGYAIPTAAGRYRRLSHAARVGLRLDF